METKRGMLVHSLRRQSIDLNLTFQFLRTQWEIQQIYCSYFKFREATNAVRSLVLLEKSSFRIFDDRRETDDNVGQIQDDHHDITVRSHRNQDVSCQINF